MIAFDGFLKNPLIFFFLGVFVFSGCSPGYIQSFVSPDFDRYTMDRIAVIPFQVGKGSENRPLFKTDRIPPAAQKKLTHLFISILKEKEKFELIPEGEVQSVLKGIHLKELTESPPKILEISTKLHADGLVVGMIDVFEERKGEAYGIVSPAAVGFVLQLIRSQDGTVVWEGSYYERQKSLMEDIRTFKLFLQRGGKWLSVEELAEFGFRRLIQDIPTMKF